MTWDSANIVPDAKHPERTPHMSNKLQNDVIDLAKAGKPEEARALARKKAPRAVYPQNPSKHYLDDIIRLFSRHDEPGEI